ncbi:aminomethyltransferase [Kordiimonas sediminis]|uniref:Aminomethyltransferase n=1 Tax=Kordiimonas sediminis TaxID=1735581 RepID=A0A919ASR3_9PROT|nr:folate-binding protein YgfZ [Kordiimonas sediminis]GHF23300.1 aminomethyltransferase [Kordiimonas sediminis]
MKILQLENRGVFRLSGPEAFSFLQGLVTNDLNLIKEGHAVYAALLTPQGKFFYDMIIFKDGDDLLLDVEADSKQDFYRRLMLYKLRADLTITDISDTHHVFAATEQPSSGIFAPDPRHSDLGYRGITDHRPEGTALSLPDYENLRLRCGVPDGSRDMEREKYFWLETDAERLNGVSFTKGCYIGQELTARMKHRTNLKKRLVPVSSTDESLETGADILTESGKKAGTLRTVSGTHALAYLRLEYIGDNLSLENGTAISIID